MTSTKENHAAEGLPVGGIGAPNAFDITNLVPNDRKPRFFRPKANPRGNRVGFTATSASIGSRIAPRTLGLQTLSVQSAFAVFTQEEESGSKRWLTMIDGNDGEGEYQDLILQVVPETNEYIASILEPLNLVSVMGPTRSGKSTLMNLLAGCKTAELFPSATGGISFTKGIDLGNKIMTVEEFSSTDGAQVAVPTTPGQQIGFLDTEGQGDQGDEYDISLFTPAILCSRIVIFNTKDVSKDSLLTQLALMTTIAQEIQLDGESEGVNTGPKFGSLIIVVNQYTLGGTVAQLEQNILGAESGNSSAVKRRNEIRTMLRSQFEDISLHILRGNTLKPGVSEALDSGEKPFLLMDDFTDPYVQDFRALRSDFTAKLQRARFVAGKSMTGQSAAGLVPSIVNAINLKEPLDIPDLWEQTQNTAISKASLTFREAFRAACDAALESSVLLTISQLTRLLDSELRLRLDDVQKALSYLSQVKISDTRKLLSDEAEIEKQNVLETNRLRVRAFAQMELDTLISSLPSRLNDEFPNLLVSTAVAALTVTNLKTRLITEYKNKINEYDTNAFPDGYNGTYETAFSGVQAIKYEAISREWAQWVIQKNEGELQSLRTGLANLSDGTPVGDFTQWKRNAEGLRLDTVSKYNATIDTGYLWDGAANIKQNFANSVGAIIDISEQGFRQNEEGVKQSVDAVSKTQIQLYQNHLRNSLKPQKEPGNFETIIDDSVYRNALQTQMESSHVGESLARTYLLDFDSQTSALKDEFRDDYQKVFNDFLQYLLAELSVLVPLRVGDFKLRADSIKIIKCLAKAALRSQLDSNANVVLATFDSDVKRFNVTQEAGILRLESARRDLYEKIEAHRSSKLALLQDVVNDWNREELNTATAPVFTGVVDFTIDTSAKLATEISKARSNFLIAGCGDNEDKEEAWASFESKTDGLYRNVRRASALFIGKVNANEGSTLDMEKIVTEKIYRTVADLANTLGMSHIASGVPFIVEIKAEDQGRSHLYKNIYKADGYDPDHRTNLKFHKWRVEFSDFEFDDPIVQELTPFVINEFNPPPPDTDTVIDVTLNQAEKETITNTNSAMFKFDLEYSTTAGVKDVASTTVKTAFGGSATFTDSKANEISFSIAFKTPVTCPANRRTTIIHLGFKQRMSMTYTAKVKIVPMVTFTGGFTRYGGGSYKSSTGDPNFHKKYTGSRNYDDIDNGYTDELKEKAAADSDPWAWRACIERYSYVQDYVNSLNQSAPYELYVRGKWEGINGWKHVIKRNISVPDIS